jgi:hypothetical protein
MKRISAFKLAGVALATTFALTGCGSDTYQVDPRVSDASADDTKIVVFADALGANWTSYSCCDATNVATFPKDDDHGTVTAFTYGNEDTTVGFSTSAPLDVSSFTETGTLDFDIKVVAAPSADGVTTGAPVITQWILHFESNGGQYNNGQTEEFPINDLVVGTWKSISHPLNNLDDLDVKNIDKVLIFPAWGEAAGSTYYVDNVVINKKPDSPAALSIDFEGAEQLTWNGFEGASALEFVANPASDSVNDSDVVAKAVIPVTGEAWAGYFADGLEVFTLDSSNSIIKMMVYKDTISPVRIKLQNGDASVGELDVSNTKTNEWEELTFNFSDSVDVSAKDNITGFSVFMDVTAREADTTNYFDNIRFTAQ